MCIYSNRQIVLALSKLRQNSSLTLRQLSRLSRSSTAGGLVGEYLHSHPTSPRFDNLFSQWHIRSVLMFTQNSKLNAGLFLDCMHCIIDPLLDMKITIRRLPPWTSWTIQTLKHCKHSMTAACRSVSLVALVYVTSLKTHIVTVSSVMASCFVSH